MTPKLTKRQQEVLDWIQQGASSKHIAQRLNLTEASIKFHLGVLFKKHGVKNRTQLILSTTKGQVINLIPIEIEQEPVMWIQESAKTIIGFSTKPIDGWTPLYRKV